MTCGDVLSGHIEIIENISSVVQAQDHGALHLGNV